MGSTHDLVQRFVVARGSTDEAVLEGFHPIKHALRFGARPDELVVLEGTPRAELPAEIADAGLTPTGVDAATFARIAPAAPPVPVVARAARVLVDPGETVAAARPGPVVVLEEPTHLGNVGAAIRVAAAAGAAGLLVTGRSDPWHPQAVRGAAGLQYALPVARADAIPTTPRPVVAFDPAGRPFGEVAAPDDPLLVFGTERRGVSESVLDSADLVVAVPMRPGVSSLNLATAVAVGLYAFCRPRVGDERPG